MNPHTRPLCIHPLRCFAAGAALLAVTLLTGCGDENTIPGNTIDTYSVTGLTLREIKELDIGQIHNFLFPFPDEPYYSANDWIAVQVCERVFQGWVYEFYLAPPEQISAAEMLHIGATSRTGIVNIRGCDVLSPGTDPASETDPRGVDRLADMP